VFEAGGESVLVYPMLRRADAAEPVANMPNGRHNPLVDLLLGYEEITSLLQKIDTVLVTHPHTDYWDLGTEDLTTRDSPIPCQPEATEKIAAASFPWIVPVDPEVKWGRLLLRRTSGRHGTGEIGRRMAPVSGFVVSSDGAPRPSTYGAPTLYLRCGGYDLVPRGRGNPGGPPTGRGRPERMRCTILGR
jgi:L-ascorbate metabolism protein UlaG (beta-lactamase superfamily)